MKVQLLAILFVGFAALSNAKAAPILVSGSAVNAFDLSPGGGVGGRLSFSGTNGLDSIVVSSFFWGGIPNFGSGATNQLQYTGGSLNGSSFTSDTSFALGGGGGFARIGTMTFPLQSFLTFTHRVYFDQRPNLLQYEDHYLISATEPVPEPSSVILGLLGIVALSLLKVKGLQSTRFPVLFRNKVGKQV